MNIIFWRGFIVELLLELLFVVVHRRWHDVSLECLLDDPVELEVHLIVVLSHEVFEEFSEVGDAGLVFKIQRSTVVEVLHKLVWEAPAQLFNACILLLVPNLIILFLLGLRWETLPRQFSLEEVHSDVPESLEVVSSRLFVAQMCVERGISRSTSEILSFLPWDVLSCLWISESLGQTKVNKIDAGRLLRSNEEVIWFDVSV